MFLRGCPGYRERADSFWSEIKIRGKNWTGSSSVHMGVDIEHDKSVKDEAIKDVLDLSDDDKVQEVAGPIRHGIDVENEIRKYSSISLPDLLLGYKKTGYDDFLDLSMLLLNYMDKDKRKHQRPLSEFRNTTHHLHSITSTGATRNVATGLYELVRFKAGDDPFENEVLKHLNPETLSFNTTPRLKVNTSENPSRLNLENMKVSRTYIFVAALKYFIAQALTSSEELTPDTFCTLDRLLASKNEDRGIRSGGHSKSYIIPSDRCQCEEGVHEWLNQFIRRINTYNKIEKLDPIFGVSRLYLAFVTRNCFGKHSREMGMILFQTLALKWMHYVAIPFDENEKELQDIMATRLEIATPELVEFLQRVLARNVGEILSLSRGTSTRSYPIESSHATSDSKVIEAQFTVDAQATTIKKLGRHSCGDILKKESLLGGVSSTLKDILESQSLRSEDGSTGKNTSIAAQPTSSQFQRSRPDSLCGTPRSIQGTPPTRRNSCVKCSAPWFWADQCDVCDWNLVQDEQPKVGPELRRLSNRTQAFKKGFVDSSLGMSESVESDDSCPMCGASKFTAECYVCGFGVTFFANSSERSHSCAQVDSDGWETESSSEKGDSCAVCDVVGFRRACFFCSCGLSPRKPVEAPVFTRGWSGGIQRKRVKAQKSRHSRRVKYRGVRIEEESSIHSRKMKISKSSTSRRHRMAACQKWLSGLQVGRGTTSFTANSDRNIDGAGEELHSPRLEANIFEAPMTRDENRRFETHLLAQHPLRYPKSSSPSRSLPAKLPSEEVRLKAKDSKRTASMSGNARHNPRMHAKESAKQKGSSSTLDSGETGESSRSSVLLVEKLTKSTLSCPWAVGTSTRRLLGLRTGYSVWEMRERDAAGGRWFDGDGDRDVDVDGDVD
ncbi:hypothetical protein DSL72_000612 [Monilinia vaccinii-corymbosi]|uniref:Uncharacterized protein n=1 Tax=Monilinia vaccinii-corymbosi TaxID=61207 RepID=A0A8A3P6L5_9HELO|nr:hypothetical protein DSL72_000612 [Monilinia vaccinii-corymbosi]